MMAIDTVAPGYVPFQDFDLTTNMHADLGMFDQLLAYPFDVIVTGHLSALGRRGDVHMTKDYALDVYRTMKRVHDGTDQMKVASAAANKYGWDNKFPVFKAVLEPDGDDLRERDNRSLD